MGSRIAALTPLEVGSGQVLDIENGYRLSISPTASKPRYSNAQLDDYQTLTRAHYPNTVNSCIRLDARFSHSAQTLAGTAGFGFWNACYADINAQGITLPKATWFFFGSQNNNFPFHVGRPGNAWFANTIDVNHWRAWRWFPALPPLALANRIQRVQQWVMPKIYHDFNIAFQALALDITQWHRYQLDWGKSGCVFRVDEQIVCKTSYSPQGPLGFVCWMDNQYLSMTTTGRVSAGLEPIQQDQWLEITNLQRIALAA